MKQFSKSTFAQCLLAALLVSPSPSGAEPGDINPHWTGRHCAECHLDAGPPALRFDGDTMLVCTRCHPAERISTDVHPFSMALPAAMRAIVPGYWPLPADTVGCVTCHEITHQMYARPLQQRVNPTFLRGGPYEQLNDFCFNCHDRSAFQKTNPHRHLNPDGSIVSERCLYCHADVPPTGIDTTPDSVTFRAPPERLCLSCHPDTSQGHPAKANHMLTPEPEVLAALESLRTDRGIELPMRNGTITCTTCHNPHQQGVTQRPAVMHGAGEELFLRLPSGYELCVTCHDDMRLQQPPMRGSAPRNIVKTAPVATLPHKPWQENKCKKCHAASIEHRTRPPALLLCMQSGCHDLSAISGPVQHEKSVYENCYFCHESHGAGYPKLLRTNTQEICSTCHPLYLPHDKTTGSDMITPEIHAQLTDYAARADLPEGMLCYYCHDTGHRRHGPRLGATVCADCHMHIRQIFLQHSETLPALTHQQYTDMTCTKCHAAHASAHEHMLLKPREDYTQ